MLHTRTATSRLRAALQHPHAAAPVDAALHVLRLTALTPQRALRRHGRQRGGPQRTQRGALVRHQGVGRIVGQGAREGSRGVGLEEAGAAAAGEVLCGFWSGDDNWW